MSRISWRESRCSLPSVSRSCSEKLCSFLRTPRIFWLSAVMTRTGWYPWGICGFATVSDVQKTDASLRRDVRQVGTEQATAAVQHVTLTTTTLTLEDLAAASNIARNRRIDRGSPQAANIGYDRRNVSVREWRCRHQR